MSGSPSRDDHREPARSSAPPSSHPAPRSDSPLSLVQERMWLLEQLDPSQDLVQSLSAAWRIEGSIQPPVLQAALDALAEAHAPLRTTLVSHDGRALQRVAAAVALPIRWVDLTHHPRGARETALREAIAHATRERLDPLRGPLFRSLLFRLDEAEHVYLTVAHRLIWDNASFAIFIRALSEQYAYLVQGGTAAVAAPAVSFPDFAAWQREQVEGPEMLARAAFWRAHLADAPPELSLPIDRPRPARVQHAASTESASIEHAQAEALRTLAESTGGTLSTVLLGAYFVLLHRLSDQRDLLVGTPVRAHARSELAGLMGPLEDTLVLRARVDGAMTFRELVTRTRDVVEGALRQVEAPLETLGIAAPVLRAFYAFEDARTELPLLGGARISHVAVEPPACGYDLMLAARESPDALELRMHYSTELFEPPTLGHLRRGVLTLLEAIVQAPDTRIDELPIAPEADVASVRDWGRPDGVLISDVSPRLDAHARNRPQAVALRGTEGALTYAELRARVTALAKKLAAHALGPSKLLAIHASTPLEGAVAVLGALRAGAAFTLLDPSFPAPRLADICRCLEADALLASEGASVPAELTLPTVRFGSETEDDTLDEPMASASDPACVLCRFDAAGRPLPSAVSHASLATSAHALANELGLMAGGVVLGLCTPSAELAVFELLAPLMAGAQLVLPEDPARLDRLPLPHFDLAFAPASTWSRLGASELARITSAVIVGEPTVGLAAKLRAAEKIVYRVHASAATALAPFVQPIVHAYEAERIGRPLFPAQAVILSRHGTICPVGALGELLVATAAELSPSHTRWHAPTERVPSIGAAAAGSVAVAFVHTGDHGRWLSDGTLLLEERRDGAVEVGGHHFDLGEIARCLEQDASVAQTVVQLSRSKSGIAQIAAYVVPHAGASCSESALREHVRASLPELMVPQAVVSLAALPRTASGQVDRSRLPAVFGSDAGNPYVAPHSEAERLLGTLWQEALGRARVSIHDNFFELGGHSLSCLWVLAQAEQKTGRRLSPHRMLLGSLEQVALELSGAPTTEHPAALESARDASTSRARLTERLLRRLKGMVRSS